MHLIESGIFSHLGLRGEGGSLSRFHRVPGNGGRGSGIGLSLVAGIARLHGAAIVTGTDLDGQGFSVRVQFPAASIPPAAA
ncbi:hypothetical protein [Hylemonella gracilis]|uniref:hypothetical protein n=1 Tax=Hylemonella gracilis TaxID=80880 RepID=UPI0018CC1C85|nr:hypothetical protein [Hylemonella gracilis]